MPIFVGRGAPFFKIARVSDEAMPVKEVSLVHFAPDILVARRCLSERVRPCRPLIDYIEGGHSLRELLDDFPAVSQEIAIECARRDLSPS